MKRLACAAAMLTVLVALPGLCAAQSGTYALIVEGASGDPEYAALYRKWVDSLVNVLAEKFRLDRSHLVVLTETPAQNEGRATAEAVRTTLGTMAKQLKASDVLFIMLIGLGSGTGNDAKFNLVGPDLTVADWNALLKPVPARIAFVDASSGSFPFVAGLAGPQRVIIAASNTPFQPTFPEKFIEAFTSDAADLDKNNRISLWEAFVYASRLVTQFYEQKGQLATEHSVIDDNGDGVGRDATSKGDDGTLSSMTYLDAAARPTSADPEVQALLQRQEALTQQVEELRRRRSTMPAAEFDREFEKLMIDLATVSREIRRKTGGGTGI